MTTGHPSARIKHPDPLDEGARETVISEEEFSVSLLGAVQEFLSGNRLRDHDPARWSKRRFHLLAEKAEALESFLDDHDARHNHRFCTLAELVASVRAFAAVAHILQHIRVRFPKYRVQMPAEALADFQESLGQAQDFASESLRDLFEEIFHEIHILGLGIEEPERHIDSTTEEPVRRHLPHDMEDATGASDEARVAAVLTRCMEVTSRFERAERMRPEPTPEGLELFLREVYDETQARGVESIIHNIQSAYDTHVKLTKIEAENPDLRIVRGHISVSLHLLEVGTLLVHFVERHENTIQHSIAKERITRVIDRSEVMRQAVFFCLFQASRILLGIQGSVAELLKRFTESEELELMIPEDGILHARPLSLIVSVVRHHGTAVEMEIEGDSTSANSIMGLIMLAGRHPDVRTVCFRGDRRPLHDLRLLFAHGLGESGTGEFPEELDYLS